MATEEELRKLRAAAIEMAKGGNVEGAKKLVAIGQMAEEDEQTYGKPATEE